MAAIKITDINRKRVSVSTDEFMAAMLSECETLFGMPIKSILNIHHVYMDRGGKMPMTQESIKEVFKIGG